MRDTDELMHPHPKSYVAGRAPRPIQITGEMSDAAWDMVPWSDVFLDIEGEKNPSPRHETRVKMLWDDTYFYFAAMLEEPHLWATLTEHDSIIYRDNDFEIFIDPDGDNLNYYEWEVNAFGTTFDLFMSKPYRAGGTNDDSWETPGIQLAIGLDGTLNDASDRDMGWCVEAAFPWTCFDRHEGGGVAPKLGDQWRVNFSRVQWDLRIDGDSYEKIPDRPEHNWVWSHQERIDMHCPWTWGYVQFEETSEVAFHPDADHEVRMRLAEMYWRQWEHFEKHGRYDAGLCELTESGFLYRLDGADGRVLTINEDSAILAQ